METVLSSSIFSIYDIIALGYKTKGYKMVREIVKPKSEEYLIHIPKEYINRSVEILILPLADEKFKTKDNFLEILKNGPVISKDEAIEWEQEIKNGYKSWQIEKF